MSQYLLSVHTPEERPSKTPSEEDMREIGARIDALEAELPWLVSGRLHDADTATVVSVALGGETLTTDGPFVEAREHIGGFYIIEAGDLDAALGWAAKVSGAIGAPIEVRPFAGLKTTTDAALLGALGG